MRSVKSVVAAGAASLLSSMAFAADMPMITPPPMYAPAPPADFGGWYLRGDIGFSNQSVSNIRKSDPTAYSQISTLNETTNFDTGGIFDVGAGYRFNSWFRADVTARSIAIAKGAVIEGQVTITSGDAVIEFEEKRHARMAG